MSRFLYRVLVSENTWTDYSEVKQGETVMDRCNRPHPVIQFAEIPGDEMEEGLTDDEFLNRTVIPGLMVGIVAYHEYKKRQK